MPTFPRTVGVYSSTPMSMPGALISFSQSGKVQTRSTLQTGRRWTEVLQTFKASSPEGRALIAFLNNCWRNGLTYDIEHFSHLTKSGGGIGNPQVNGAGQTGTTLNTYGWGLGTNPVVKEGDIIRLAGISQVFDITEDAPNLVSGGAALKINPPIFTGASPAHNAAITHTGVRLNAILAEKPSFPAYGANEFIVGLSVVHAEVV